MPENYRALFLMILLLTCSAALGEWWEEKPYTEWSVEQVDTVLNNSPWVRLAPAAPATRSGRNSALATFVPLYYQVRLLTARPIREGFLRMLALGMRSATADIREFSEDARVGYGSRLLQEFLRSYPEDVRAQGDEHHIILAVTLKEAYWDSSTSTSSTSTLVQYPKYRELTNADELSNIDLSNIQRETSLTTSTGRRVGIMSYIKPGGDRLGAKFYFPRNLPDATPLIAAGDKELLFETRIKNSKIKVKFDLKKTVYRGKTEL